MMAQEALGKAVKQLKQERTLAKSAFTKQANFLSSGVKYMTRSDLQEEFKKLLSEARNVSNTNEEYRAGLLADIEADMADGEEAELGKQQHADLEKTIHECEVRLEEVRKIVLSNLWSRYGEDEIETAIQEAETACDRAAAIPIIAVNKDGYEFQLNGAKGKIQGAITSLAVWEVWIPAAEKLECRMSGN